MVIFWRGRDGSAMERRSLRRICMVFLWLCTQLAMHDELEAAFAMFGVAAAAGRLLAEPSRRQAASNHWPVSC